MFFGKKIRRVLDVEGAEKRNTEEEKEALEKGDLLAMIISAFRVFTPVILILIAVVWGLYWRFTH